MTKEAYENAIELIRNSKEKTFILTDENGKKSRHRLFVSQSGIVAEYKHRSTRYGHPFSLMDYVKIESAEEDLIVTMRKNVEKIIKYISASGLWTCLLEDLKRLADFPDSQVQELLKYVYDDWKILSEKMHELSIDELDALMLSNLFQKSIIKTARYNKRLFNEKNILDAINNKTDCHTSWENGYDCRASVKNTEKGYKGWYSEEYRGCGNGYYYILLDHKHVFFIEKD